MATESLRGVQFVPTTGGRVQPGQPPETTGFTISVEDGFDPAVVDSTTSVVAIHEFVNKLLANDSIGNDSFGLSVAANNDVVIVGKSTTKAVLYGIRDFVRFGVGASVP